MSTLRHREPGWADVLLDHVDRATSQRLIGQLGACEAAALAFCRLLERWARGEPEPSTPGRRQAALRRAADRIETALVGLEGPLGRYLLELEADHAEGRSWYGAPGAAELLEWQDKVGSLEPGRYADLIAVGGDPLKDISELQRVKFVMKGGLTVRNLQEPVIAKIAKESR